MTIKRLEILMQQDRSSVDVGQKDLCGGDVLNKRPINHV